MSSNGPKIEHYSLSEGLQYALLDLVEFAAYFNLSGKRIIEKQAALYAVRSILKDEMAEILYEENGRPYLRSGQGISISHSYDRLTVLISSVENEVGIDIEKVRDKILKIKHKFLSEAELDRLKNVSLEELTVYWGAKEAVYKAGGIAGLLFAEQIFIEPFFYSQQGGKIMARVKNEHSQKKYTLQYKIMNDYVLVFTDLISE